jgi:hypothetical protein
MWSDVTVCLSNSGPPLEAVILSEACVPAWRGAKDSAEVTSNVLRSESSTSTPLTLRNTL